LNGSTIYGEILSTDHITLSFELVRFVCIRIEKRIRKKFSRIILIKFTIFLFLFLEGRADSLGRSLQAAGKWPTLTARNGAAAVAVPWAAAGCRAGSCETACRVSGCRTVT
jgi:hypothetical protein